MRKKIFRSVLLVWAPLAGVAAVDQWTGPNISMLLLYAVPVAFAVILMGIRGGLIAAFCAGGAVFATESIGGGVPVATAGWNALTNLVVLALLASLLHTNCPLSSDSTDPH